MPSATDMFGLIAMLSMMGLMVAFAVFHTKRIRAGRADPLVSPDWTSIERPTTPPTSIRWGNTEIADVEDDHVGHPFPPSPS